MQFHRHARRGVLAVVAAGALVAPAGAAAHVTVQPQSGVAAGGFAKLDIRVPNERDKANTTKVSVQVPPGFYFLNYAVVPGWTAKITKEKLNPPVDLEGEKVTEQVKQVTWTADDPKKGGIAPGQFQDFGLSGGPIPGKAGDKLPFPAIQTYSNGEVVRWIASDPNADTPASALPVIAKSEPGAAAKPAAATPAASTSDESDGDFASKGLGIAALIVGALGLLIGIAAFAASRRKPAA
jgi:uncharacterized protein